MKLTRRAVLALPWLAAARAAVAQPAAARQSPSDPSPPGPTLGPSTLAHADLPRATIFASDSQRSSILLAQTLASRLGAHDFEAESSPDVAHSVTALINRDQNNLAILPSSVLASLDGRNQSITNSIRFIARICVMEVHVLATNRFGSVAQLAGQRVNVGPLGSQDQITASLLLERAGVPVEPVYDADEPALASLIQHRLAAMIFLASKPSRLLFSVNLSDGVHLLPILESTSSGRATGGFRTQIDPQDYPLLSGAESGVGQPIPTTAIPLVLACYDWPVVSGQFITFARVADLLSQRESGLRGFGMNADVPGWQRFGPISDWLKNGGSVSAIATASQRSAAPQRIDYQKLYQQFLDWEKHHQ
jgi:hypothetical protein